MTLLPLLLFWPLALAAFFARTPAPLIYLFFGCVSFGALAVVPTAATGGLTLLPGPVVALLIIARTFLAPGGVAFVLTAAFRPERLTLLFVFLVIAWTTTMFMPRLFTGMIDIIPVRGVLSYTAPLVPTTQNVSQLLYLTISVLAVFAFTRLFGSVELRQHAFRALCFGAAMLLFTGVVDFASQYVGAIKPLLAPFRTGTYSMATEVMVLGGKRVVGLTPEASAYGALCLSFLSVLYFLRRAIRDERLREVVAPCLCIGLVLMIWLAKSTGAYIGLVLFLSIAACEWVVRAGTGRTSALASHGLRAEFWLAFGGLLALAAIVLFDASTLQPIYDMVDRMVLTKSSSDSFEQRGFWRATATAAFWSSWGLGVGVGSTRASSAFVALFAATGVLGGIAYYGFVLQTMLRRAMPGDAEGAVVMATVRLAYIPSFVIGLFNGSEDFGVQRAFTFGLATAVGLAALQARRAGAAVASPAAQIRRVPRPGGSAQGGLGAGATT